MSKKRIYYLTKNISISFNYIYFFYVRTLIFKHNIITLKINLLEYVAVNLNSMVIVSRLDRMLNAGYETRVLKIILMLFPRYESCHLWHYLLWSRTLFKESFQVLSLLLYATGIWFVCFGCLKDTRMVDKSFNYILSL